MAHRIFRSFPSPDEVADRIDAFVELLRLRRIGRALCECPIEGLLHALEDEEDLLDAIRRRCPSSLDDFAGLGAVMRGSELEMIRRQHDAVLVRARFPGAVMARFDLLESRDDRWTLWFVRFEASSK